ncbi:hypothetical protein EQ500_03250 [Lactobacillus sp. XV13L]|nr:hypothetical protein [Lactobacillus sp. XV13L]
MKKQLTTFIALAASILILSGCHNSQSNANHDQQIYSSVMVKGKQAVAQNNFAAADAYYQAALTAKPDDSQAKIYQQQAQALNSAQKALDRYSLAEAKDHLEDVKDNDHGSSKMQARARKLLQLIPTIQNHRKEYRNQIEKAATASDSQDYKRAQNLVVALLEKTDFHKRYYRDFYQQANELLLTSVKNLKSDTSQATANQPAAADNAEHAPGESDAIKNPTANGQKITPADIQKAKADGRSTITPEDAGF